MKQTLKCEKNFSRAVKRYDMLSCDSVLVGLSGGADSVVLLHILKKEAAKRGFFLYALHVNHMIRGEEADRDEEFCRTLCKEWDIPFHSVKLDVPKIAKEAKTGLEETARNLRYEIFQAFCKENGIKRIATAHNSSDNLETVLFNITRGSSIKGACGIPPVRENIIRPLIFCTKSEINEYLESNRLEHVYDSTNSLTDYSRNLIRHNVVPELLKVNSSPEDAVSRMSELLREDSDYLEKSAAEVSDNSVSVLKKLENAILRRVIRNLYAENSDSELSYTHVCDILNLVKSGVPHSKISLPDGISATIENGRLIFVREEKEKTTPDYVTALVLGENIIEKDDSVIFICKKEDENEEIKNYLTKKQNIYKIFIKATIAFDIINFSLSARNKKDGDKYVFGGMTRSVKKLFNEKKLPLDVRSTLPVLESDGSIIWIAGFPVADSVSPEKNKNLPQISVYYMKGSS